MLVDDVHVAEVDVHFEDRVDSVRQQNAQVLTDLERQHGHDPQVEEGAWVSVTFFARLDRVRDDSALVGHDAHFDQKGVELNPNRGLEGLDQPHDAVVVRDTLGPGAPIPEVLNRHVLDEARNEVAQINVILRLDELPVQNLQLARAHQVVEGRVVAQEGRALEDVESVLDEPAGRDRELHAVEHVVLALFVRVRVGEVELGGDVRNGHDADFVRVVHERVENEGYLVETVEQHAPQKLLLVQVEPLHLHALGQVNEQHGHLVLDRGAVEGKQLSST